MNPQIILLGVAWAISIFYVFAWHKLKRLSTPRALLINAAVSGLVLALFYRLPHCSTLFSNACSVLAVALIVALCNFWAATAVLVLRLGIMAKARIGSARR